MKLNKYLNFQEIDGNHYLFNLANESVLYLVPELTDLVKAHSGDIDALKDIHPDLYDAMAANGMISETEVDDTEAFIDGRPKAEAESFVRHDHQSHARLQHALLVLLREA